MKLGSLKEGGRDGTLVVVSRDLSQAIKVPDIAPTLQAALDDWDNLEPELRAIYRLLNQGDERNAFPLDPVDMASPLPRAYQWADASAYLNHVDLVRKSRGATMPPSFLEDPLMYQGGSDHFLAPTDDIAVASEDYGIDFEAEIAAIVKDIPMGADPARCGAAIALLMIVNDVSLRGLIPAELAKGFGFFHGKPPTAFAPVAVTPDELGDAWTGGTIALPIVSTWNGKEFGHPDAGTDMNFTLPQLIAHAAKTRDLRAGTIVGSGTVSNKDSSQGFSCIAEIRAVEAIAHGEPKTGFMKFGDTIRIEMLDTRGQTIFGAIDQTVVKYDGPA
jgi:fumarylacetoacetate (FAA) hydrolase